MVSTPPQPEGHLLEDERMLLLIKRVKDQKTYLHVFIVTYNYKTLYVYFETLSIRNCNE